MTVLVGRRESFNAAHQLSDPGLSDEENQRLFGKCANLLGHNYVLEVVVAGPARRLQASTCGWYHSARRSVPTVSPWKPRTP